MPPMSSASATGSELVSGSFQPRRVAMKPPTEVIRKATTSFAR